MSTSSAASAARAEHPSHASCPTIGIWLLSVSTLTYLANKSHLLKSPPSMPARFRRRLALDVLPEDARITTLAQGLMLSKLAHITQDKQLSFKHGRLVGTNPAAKTPTPASVAFTSTSDLFALACPIAPTQADAQPFQLGVGLCRIGSVTDAAAQQSLTFERRMFCEAAFLHEAERERRLAFSWAALEARLSACHQCRADLWRSAEVGTNLQVSTARTGEHMLTVATPHPAVLRIFGAVSIVC